MTIHCKIFNACDLIKCDLFKETAYNGAYNESTGEGYISPQHWMDMNIETIFKLIRIS